MREHVRRNSMDSELAAGGTAVFRLTGLTVARYLSVLRQAGLVTEGLHAHLILYLLASE